MARLEDMLPPGEMVRWRSPKHKSSWPIFGWGLLAGGGVAWFSSMLKDATEPGLLLFAAIGLAVIGIVMVFLYGFNRIATAKLAVTEAHIVWVDGFGGGGDGKAALRNISAVDLEEGANAANLHCDGKTYRIELTDGSDLEAIARAIGRPARIWRKCTSLAARRARRWQLNIGGLVAGLTVAAGGFVAASSVFYLGGVGMIAGNIAGVVVIILGQPFAWIAGQTAPHLLVGRRLGEAERRDFVGWITDPRWHGVKPNRPVEEPMRHFFLYKWAMRKAYGEIPDIGEREPEILIRGDFPPD